jgi:HEAT repeat protein
MRTLKIVIVTAFVAVASPALAGRGSSPGAILSAINSGGVDAIQSELERAEHLVCPQCVRMVRPLLDHQDRRVRQVAAWWLGRRGLQNELYDTMNARLAGSDPIAARNAADVLGSLRMRLAIQPLGRLLVDSNGAPEARGAAARAVRAAALESLRELRGEPDPALAVPLLGDADEDVRVQAIYTIGHARGKALTGPAGETAVRGLAAVVTSDPSARVRKKAAWALGEIGAPVSLAGPALSQAAAKDSDPLVRSLAGASQGKLAR